MQGQPIAAVKQNNCFEKLSKYHMKTLEMAFFLSKVIGLKLYVF